MFEVICVCLQKKHISQQLTIRLFNLELTKTRMKKKSIDFTNDSSLTSCKMKGNKEVRRIFLDNNKVIVEILKHI